MLGQSIEEKVLIEGFDPRNLPDDFYADPYPYYRVIQQNDPVHQCADGSFFLSKHADLQSLSRPENLQFR